MKTVCFVPAAALLPCWGVLALSAMADAVQLRPAVPLQATVAPMGPGTYAIPFVTDWNGDGRKDLLVGYQTAGKIAVYLNSGTDAVPQFTNYYLLRYFQPTNNSWQEIWHPSGGCGAPCPWVCDFDGDGKRDLLVGDGQFGTVYFYRNTNTDAAPILYGQQRLQVGTINGTTNLMVGPTPIRAAPCVNDWDEDGLPDLLCGSGDGYVYFFKNTNTAQAPIFAPGLRVQAGGGDLNPGIRSVPRVLDWDGDGLKDLVCSSDIGVYWCRNTNSNRAPILQAPVPICAPLPDGSLPVINPVGGSGARLRVFPVDWNNDGLWDLLVGDASGSINYYEGYQFRFTSTRLESGGFALQWDSAPYLRYNLLASPSLDHPAWSLVTNPVSAGNSTAAVVGTNGTPGGRQFYRLRIAP